MPRITSTSHRRAILLFAAMLIALSLAQQAQGLVNAKGSFDFDYGSATPVIGVDPSSVQNVGILSTPPYANFPQTQEAREVITPGTNQYDGSFGNSSYSVTTNPNSGGVSWDLTAESTVAGVRRISSFLVSPVATVSM